MSVTLPERSLLRLRHLRWLALPRGQVLGILGIGQPHGPLDELVAVEKPRRRRRTCCAAARRALAHESAALQGLLDQVGARDVGGGLCAVLALVGEGDLGLLQVWADGSGGRLSGRLSSGGLTDAEVRVLEILDLHDGRSARKAGR